MNLSRRYSVVLLLMLAVSLAGCTGIPVSTDYDTSREFPSLSTYAWMVPKQKLVEDPTVDNDLMNNRVMRAVDSELFARGFEKASGDASADFLITYHVSAENRQSVSSFHGSYGYYPCWQNCYQVGFRNDTYIRYYKQGTFMIDVIDPASSALIWRGIAGRRLTADTPQERDSYVNEIVAAILAEFPPGYAAP
ncbi:MAG: DUF4136 domain-containing protein [Oceanicoccus sp.]